MDNISYLGRRSGKLKVISIFPKKDKRQTRIMYECLCDCHKRWVVLGDNFRAGKVKSCGCLKVGRKLGSGVHQQFSNRKDAITHFLYRLKFQQHKRLEKKGRVCQDFLTFEQFVALILKQCFYCGIEWSLVAKDNYNGQLKRLMSDTEVRYNGIDRVDSDLGYTIGNCVPCCKRCNLTKNTMSQTEFFAWIVSVYQHVMHKGKIF